MHPMADTPAMRDPGLYDRSMRWLEYGLAGLCVLAAVALAVLR